jgi:S-adenosylmethionine:tRNA-ribosyltransferase-isomerase (queuine synthetase)
MKINEMLNVGDVFYTNSRKKLKNTVVGVVNDEDDTIIVYRYYTRNQWHWQCKHIEEIKIDMEYNLITLKK